MPKCPKSHDELKISDVSFEPGQLGNVLSDEPIVNNIPTVKCPECSALLADEQIRKLWASRNGSRTSEAKRQAARENGKKRKAKSERHNTIL